MIYKFKLASNKAQKTSCPACKKSRRWQRYLNAETGEILPEKYGRCDREIKCGEWIKPDEKTEQKKENKITLSDGRIIFDFAFSEQLKDEVKNLPGTKWNGQKKVWEIENSDLTEPVKIFAEKNAFTIYDRRTVPPVFMPTDVLHQTLNSYEKNKFVQNLLHRVSFPFPPSDLEKVISLYRLGTIGKGYRAGAVTFPFIDIDGKIRAIQVKEFDEQNHTAKNGTGFLHSMKIKEHERRKETLPDWLKAYTEQPKKVSCLFGEHLLNRYPSNPVALAEAPKTAIYGSLYFGFPDVPENLLWTAVYNLSSLNFAKVKALQGRTVFLFPDLSESGTAFNQWSRKAKELERQLPGTKFIVSDLLERNATEQERKAGGDIADFLIRHDWRTFRNAPAAPLPGSLPDAGEPPAAADYNELLYTITKSNNSFDEGSGETDRPADWQLKDLEQFFKSVPLPTHPVQLKAVAVRNVSKFVRRHLEVVKWNEGRERYLPYLERLKSLREHIQSVSKFDLK